MRLFILFVVLNCLTVGCTWFREREVVTRTQASTVSGLWVPHSCTNKKYCITVYIAPWCGACNATLPTFKSLNQSLDKLRPNTGFGIVIGSAPVGDLRKKSNELSPIEAYLDESGDVTKNSKISGYPTWVVTDETGKETQRLPGGLNVTSEQALEAFLKQHLHL